MEKFLVLLLAGIGLYLLSPVITAKGKEKRCSAYTSATVTDLKTVAKRRRFKKVNSYIPTVTYEVDGRPYTGIYPRTYDPEEYHTGDSCWVMYNPVNPREYYQYDELVTVKNRLLAVAGGWFLLLAGTVMFAVYF
jgi:hypothetical protein